MGLEGIVSKHKLSRYTSGPLTGLAQEQESGERGGAAGGGGRLGQAAMAIASGPHRSGAAPRHLAAIQCERRACPRSVGCIRLQVPLVGARSSVRVCRLLSNARG